MRQSHALSGDERLPGELARATVMTFDAVAASRVTEGGAAAVKCLFRC